MREIKFRAWDGKEFIYFGLTSLIVNAVEGNIEKLYNLLRAGNFNPDRYTGRKDKNGVEIWEGDIAQTPNPEYRVGWAPFEVEFGTFNRIDGSTYTGWNISREECEVIGNIYENTVLMEKVA